MKLTVIDSQYNVKLSQIPEGGKFLLNGVVYMKVNSNLTKFSCFTVLDIDTGLSKEVDKNERVEPCKIKSMEIEKIIL